MRIKELFTIPKNEKITEKVFARVLLSSVCSILLCMTCLAGTTWAWFTVSVENTGNVIQIGTAKVNASIISIDGQEPASDATLLVGADDDEDGGGINLPAGEYVFEITHANDYDDLDTKSTLYVTLTASGVTADGEDAYVCGYVVLDGDNEYEATVTIQAAESCSLSLGVSWFAPANADKLEENILIYPVIDEMAGTTAESTEGMMESTMEESTESTEETEESLEQPTQETTAPEETTATEEGITEEATTPAAETTTEAVDTTEPSEQPTQETTAPEKEPTQATSETEETSAEEGIVPAGEFDEEVAETEESTTEAEMPAPSV